MSDPVFHQCPRCSQVHNGALPDGWGYFPGHGTVCEDCRSALAAQIRDIALTEYRHVRDIASGAIRSGDLSQPDANERMTPWAAIAMHCWVPLHELVLDMPVEDFAIDLYEICPPSRWAPLLMKTRDSFFEKLKGIPTPEDRERAGRLEAIIRHLRFDPLCEVELRLYGEPPKNAPLLEAAA